MINIKRLNKYIFLNKKISIPLFLSYVLESMFAVVYLVFSTKLVNAVYNKDIKLVKIFITLIVLTYILQNLITFCMNRLRFKYLELVKKELILDLTTDIQKQQLSLLTSSDKYFSWINNDIEMIKNNYYSNILNLLSEVSYVIFSFSFLIVMIKSITIFVGLLSILFCVLIIRYSGFLEKNAILMSKENEKYMKYASNFLSGMKIFYLENRKNLFINHMYILNTDIKRIRLDLIYLKEYLITTLNFIALIIQVIMILIAGLLVIYGKVEIGFLIIIGNVMGRLMNSAYFITGNILMMNMSKNIRNNIITELKPMTTDSKKVIENIDNIEYKNVTVKRNDNIIIENFNKIFEKGKKYAVIGESGVGKSTLLNLLLGYAPDYMGTILVNGIDIKEISSESLFSNISYVNSDNIVFLTDILNNINLYGSIDSENIEKIIEELKLTDIEKDKIIDENNISTGQKQRINLARMLLSDKQVIILDEATANVDKDNRERIENKILSNKEKTVIMITHHLDESLRAKFDEVIEIGRVIYDRKY